MRILFRARTMLAASLACVACDATGPNRAWVGTFVLESVDGGALPDSVEDPVGLKYEFLAETLTVAANRSVRFTTWIVMDVDPAKLETEGTASVVADSVFITDDVTGFDVAAGAFEPNAIELRMDVAFFWSGRLLRYRRVDEP